MVISLRSPTKRTAVKICFIFLAFLICSLGPKEIRAASFFDQFIDPYDSRFDTSQWILDKKGALPVPIIITEPAVGYGAGAALLFFHAKEKAPPRGKTANSITGDRDAQKPVLPPSISGLVGLGTENGTWAAGGFHFGSWKEDRMRYLGGVVYPSVNLTFYGGGESPIFSKGLDYNLQGWFLLQELLFRLKNSNFFLGPRLIYYNTTSTFDLKLPVEGIDPWEFSLQSYGVGLKAAYDSRDNIFTPNTGIDASITSLFYTVENDATGNKNYRMTDAVSKIYWRIFADIVLGWRLHGGFSSGDVPFYALPFIDMRGIPAMRYQGNNILVTEVETRWNVSERWSLIFFGGVGRTADAVSDFSASDNRWSGGTGFRYLMARVLGMYTGIDIARGPEDWAFYIQVGSAWTM